MGLAVAEFSDRGHGGLELDLAVGDLVGDGHKDLGLHADLDLAIRDHGDGGVGDLRLATSAYSISILTRLLMRCFGVLTQLSVWPVSLLVQQW